MKTIQDQQEGYPYQQYQQNYPRQIDLFVPVKFVWKYGGNEIFLIGDFTRWMETIKMKPTSDQPGHYFCIVQLHPGVHQYRFIVDGNWLHDEQSTFSIDPMGVINNFVVVPKQENIQGYLTAQQVPQVSAMSNPNLMNQQQVPFQQNQGQGIDGDIEMSNNNTNNPAHNNSNIHNNNSDNNSSSNININSNNGDSSNLNKNITAQIIGQPIPNKSIHQKEVNKKSARDLQILPQEKEPFLSKNKLQHFLANHVVYELIPESARVVLIDMDFPVRQAFHALQQQGVVSAPLWDCQDATINGMISASDFIHTLRRLRTTVHTKGNPLSEAEMDRHTIRDMRMEAQLEGRQLRQLVYIKPNDSMFKLCQTLLKYQSSTVPVLSCDPTGSDMVPQVLYMATHASILLCILQHFRASYTSLPLLQVPIMFLAIGTWNQDSQYANQQTEEVEGQYKRTAQLLTVQPTTPLAVAWNMLLEHDVSALPVVDSTGQVLNIYSRGDITSIAAGNFYQRLQYEEVNVQQALEYLENQNKEKYGFQQQGGPFQPDQQAPSQQGGSQSHSPHSFRGQEQQQRNSFKQDTTQKLQGYVRQVHLFICYPQDPLRHIFEKLSIPGIRRLIIVDPQSRKLEGVLSLTDISSYLFSNDQQQ